MKIHSNGFTLIEVLLAMALLLTVTVGTIAGNSLATKGTQLSQQRANANRLAQEAMEAVHGTRAAFFPALNRGIYHPVQSPTGWRLDPGPETIEGFNRQIILASVYRSLACTEGVCEIVEAGGIVDEGSLKATVEVDWEENNETHQIILETLITYWR
jgi:prepilin-type N-terminal cleavage/methylation domain-containing protein